MEFLTHLFDTADFPARWHCGAWTSGHGWLHIVSDLGVWSAYVAIPFVLAHFCLRRQDLPFRGIFLLFGAFILACGTTHLMEAIIFWWPAYRLAGVIKLLTAIVSWSTVIALVPVVPRVLAMRSPDELEREVQARKIAEAALQEANRELEQRIEQRTAELVRSNAELRLEQERFRTTLASIGDAVIATDAAGRVTFQNPVAEGLTGWREDWLGQPLPVVFHIVNEQTEETVESPAEKVLREGAIVGLANHTVLIARDGSRRPIDDSGAPIRDAEGAILGVVLVFRDVSERRRVEQRLEAARALVQRVADAVPALIAYIDSDGHYQLNNKAYETWFGYPREELVGMHMREALGEPAWEAIQTHFRSALAGQVVTYEAQVPYRQGGNRWISATYTPDVNEQGIVRGIIAHVTDITAHKRSEQALQEADRRKDEFLALLAHELRNPLAPIRNGLQVLRLANGDQQATEQARDMMERQLAHLVHLVDDLLDVSRISRGKIELRKERIELSELVRHAVETCEPAIQEQGHVLEVALPPQPIRVEGDRTRIVQALCNLLNNAAKYTDQGGQIWLAASRQQAEVVIAVRDTGVGIPPSMLPQVFEMFTQVDRSLEKARGGLGIGLTIAKRLVEMHGGTIEARSEGLGRGSEFIVRLPMSEADSLPLPNTESNAQTHSASLSILVVDDNRDAATSLAMMLKLMGHEVQTAYDGLKAVETAAEIRPDLVLMDVGMPLLNGFEATRRIRAEPWSRGITIVALTGWGQEEDKRQSREVGCDGHLVKPVDLTLLRNLLAELMDRHNKG